MYVDIFGTIPVAEARLAKGTQLGMILSFMMAVTAVTFTVLGVVASAAGKLMGTFAGWWNILLGVLRVLMALQTWEKFDLSQAPICCRDDLCWSEAYYYAYR